VDAIACIPQSRVGLDCLNFLIGSIQTSLGTFVAFYLADLGWSKESVGLALATGQIAGGNWQSRVEPSLMQYLERGLAAGN
jgi:hypothetical protein